MNIQACLATIVGLSNRDCNCTGTKPEGATTSLSGWFLDDPIDGVPLNWLEASLDCQDSMWGMLDKARTHALQEFYQEFVVAFSRNNRALIDGFTGTLGEGEDSSKINKLLDVSGYDEIGAYMSPYYKFIGSSAIVTGLGLYLSEAGTFEVNIVRLNDGELMGSYEIEAEEDKKTMFTLPVGKELPLTDYAGNSINYKFTYDPGTARPWNVLWNCGCTSYRKPWEDFLTTVGVGITGGNVTKDTENTMGLYVEMSLGCRSDNWLCEAVKFPDDPFFKVMAKCIQYMGFRATLKYILKNNKLSYYGAVAKERAQYDMANFNKEITWRIEWLAANAPKWVANCYTCNKENITKGSIVI